MASIFYVNRKGKVDAHLFLNCEEDYNAEVKKLKESGLYEIISDENLLCFYKDKSPLATENPRAKMANQQKEDFFQSADVAELQALKEKIESELEKRKTATINRKLENILTAITDLCNFCDHVTDIILDVDNDHGGIQVSLHDLISTACFIDSGYGTYCLNLKFL